MKILVCEDDPVMMLVLSTILKKFEYEVICSKDGKEALDIIRTKLPDMVITDMLLPHYSGPQIISYIKNLPGKKVPVILLSSMPINVMKNNDEYFGADGYLMKPVLPQELKNKIEELKHVACRKIAF